MRIQTRLQRSIFDNFAEHQLGQELSAISKLLDENPEIIEYAAKDLIRVNTRKTGREGLTVESVVRCAILKQHRQLTYEELAFYLEDSQSYQSFARLDGKIPKKSALQKTITLIKDSTWEKINRVLLKVSLIKGIETGKKVRIDSTDTETNIHYPTDSSLLWDAIRIIISLLETAKELSSKVKYCNSSRKAKRLFLGIRTAKEKKRTKKYRELVKITERKLKVLQEAKTNLEGSEISDIMKYFGWVKAVEYSEALILKVINQTKRRVFLGEKVPAVEKIVSLYEPHTDIISKGGRETKFGHKINLTSGATGIILDAVIEKGNPADSNRLIPMLERQIDIYGESPDKASVDGGYASKENLKEAKEKLKIKEIAFHKKCGLKIEDMVKSKWVYKQLRNFRAGIEGNISCLKRAYGLKRCTWKGLEKFKSYVWSSIVSYNLSLIAKLLPQPG